MAREKPDVWGCQHPLPIEVVPMGDGRRAGCLRCGRCGPVRPDAEGALRALRGMAARREKIGA
jgi:polyferredoxin